MARAITTRMARRCALMTTMVTRLMVTVSAIRSMIIMGTIIAPLRPAARRAG